MQRSETHFDRALAEHEVAGCAPLHPPYAAKLVSDPASPESVFLLIRPVFGLAAGLNPEPISWAIDEATGISEQMLSG